jgi:NADH-quinone oxidoreductase subunit L
MKYIYLAIPLLPLLGAILAGVFGKFLTRNMAHWVTILGVAGSFVLSLFVGWQHIFNSMPTYNESVYTWMVSDGIRFEIGFLIDRLTVLMLIVVTFISLMVHIYTIGYMHDDPGYKRFFSYIALFTFSMLMLVTSNNFLQLFFGWEAVGLVSYLLIGFWYTRPTAIFANLKAFLVNRVGDFGFLLGIAAVLMYFGSLDYAEVFSNTASVNGKTMQIFPGLDWSVMTVICLCLFVGAMGKSAQVPLHVWLPDSMEGPTPISALIHAATMVTAGIFMVARMSPLYELSEVALSTVMIIGATTALFMGFLGIIQNDIKRVVAYSTLSQLGYMTVALGASAYAAGIFHLMTHAFFKALLFLGAGSVIIAMHHEQDIRKMGGLRKYMPITWITALIGSLALIGFPGFAGFYSKDAIIEAVHHSDIWGSGYAYVAVLAGVFVTAFYSFRMYFLVFHTKERMDEHTREHLHETPAVVTVPLILLAIPSIAAGWVIGPLLFGDYFGDAIYVAEVHNVLSKIEFHGVWDFTVHGIQHGLMGGPFLLAMLGLGSAGYIYLVQPSIAEWFQSKLSIVYKLLENKYYADALNEKIIAPAGRGIGKVFWKAGDAVLIDGLVVNGSAKVVGWCAGVIRHIQTGYLYTYAFTMIMGLIILLAFYAMGWF